MPHKRKPPRPPETISFRETARKTFEIFSFSRRAFELFGLIRPAVVDGMIDVHYASSLKVAHEASRGWRNGLLKTCKHHGIAIPEERMRTPVLDVRDAEKALKIAYSDITRLRVIAEILEDDASGEGKTTPKIDVSLIGAILCQLDLAINEAIYDATKANTD